MTARVILIAHGSRAEVANEAHRQVSSALAARTGEPVVAAFLELAEPSIPDAIDAAVADGAVEILLLPYFLHPGRHLRSDLPRLAGEARDRHPQVAVELLPAFGEDEGVIDLLAVQVGRARSR